MRCETSKMRSPTSSDVDHGKSQNRGGLGGRYTPHSETTLKAGVAIFAPGKKEHH